MTKKPLFTITLFLAIILLTLYFAVPYKKVYLRLKSKGYLNESVNLNEIDSAKGTMVALTLGQSNASNSGQVRYTPHNKILNYANNKLYTATDPLIGTTGDGGSVWGILGDMLIDSGIYKKIVLIPIGIGSTSVSCWADSSCHEQLTRTLRELRSNHIRVTHIFWHQGESDLGTSRAYYKVQLKKVLQTIRAYGQDAPFYCSIASYNPGLPNAAVSNAQKDFIKESKNVFYGPETDYIIAKGDRWQKVHFTQQGMNKYAVAWFHAILINRR